MRARSEIGFLPHWSSLARRKWGGLTRATLRDVVRIPLGKGSSSSPMIKRSREIFVVGVLLTTGRILSQNEVDFLSSSGSKS